jgi:hypothetical protein
MFGQHWRFCFFSPIQSPGSHRASTIPACGANSIRAPSGYGSRSSGPPGTSRNLGEFRNSNCRCGCHSLQASCPLKWAKVKARNGHLERLPACRAGYLDQRNFRSINIGCPKGSKVPVSWHSVLIPPFRPFRDPLRDVVVAIEHKRAISISSRADYTVRSEWDFTPTPEKWVPVQLVDATPSELEALCKGGVYVDQRQAKRAFCGAESRVVEPLEGGPVAQLRLAVPWVKTT